MKITVLISVAVIGMLSAESTLDKKLLPLGATWHERWRNALTKLDRFSREEQHVLLSEIVSSQGRWENLQNHPELFELFHEAQTALVSIPGHAKYYQDKIESMRAEALVNAKRPEAELTQLEISGKAAIGEWDFHESYQTSFLTLRFLPSPETVRVLGTYLNDPLGRDGKSLLGHNLKVGGDTSPIPGPAASAAIAISKLGIESPPFDRPGARSDTNWTDDQEIDAWKDWWNEVKAGKRTYRFTGSNIDYGPDGPATKEQVEKNQRDHKRTEERSAGHRKAGGSADMAESEPRPNARPTTLIVALSLAALAALVWYFSKLRRRRAD